MVIRPTWWPYAAAGYVPRVTAVDPVGRPARAVCPACDSDVPVSSGTGWLTPHGAHRRPV